MKSIRNQKSEIRNKTIYPVIMAVPETIADLSPRERVRFLSRHARRALALSAEKSRVPLGELVQDEQNAPLPFNGNYWSITHKTQYVGGVVSPSPIGIDIEKICSRTRALFKKVADDTEWSLADRTFETFFRYWTAKEAVLKVAGIGLKALSKCRVLQVPDAHHLDVGFKGRTYHVEHHYFDGHIASIVKNGFEIRWTVV